MRKKTIRTTLARWRRPAAGSRGVVTPTVQPNVAPCARPRLTWSHWARAKSRFGGEAPAYEAETHRSRPRFTGDCPPRWEEGPSRAPDPPGAARGRYLTRKDDPAKNRQQNSEFRTCVHEEPAGTGCSRPPCDLRLFVKRGSVPTFRIISYKEKNRSL